MNSKNSMILCATYVVMNVPAHHLFKSCLWMVVTWCHIFSKTSVWLSRSMLQFFVDDFIDTAPKNNFCHTRYEIPNEFPWPIHNWLLIWPPFLHYLSAHVMRTECNIAIVFIFICTVKFALQKAIIIIRMSTQCLQCITFL